MFNRQGGGSNLNIVEIITRQLIEPHYQPIVSLNGGTIVGCEALVRGPEGKLRMPVDLFNEAARYRVSINLDTLCFITAARRAPPTPFGLLFVNLQPATMVWLAANPGLIKKAEVYRPPEFTVIEIVEKEVPCASQEEFIAVLAFFRRRGYALALDDMASGYNRLHLAAAVKPDFIKLDRPLIQNCHQDDKLLQNLSLLTQMGRNFGSRIIAECIENERELEAVKNAGVDFGQGYCLGRPAPAAYYLKQTIGEK